jgi:hypothetical protein
MWGFLAVIIMAAILNGSMTFSFRWLWLAFTWRMLGIKPNILNEEQMKQTVEEAAQSMTIAEIAQAELAGYELTEEEKARFLDAMQHNFRWAIERYIERFKLNV